MCEGVCLQWVLAPTVREYTGNVCMHASGSVCQRITDSYSVCVCVHWQHAVVWESRFQKVKYKNHSSPMLYN